MDKNARPVSKIGAPKRAIQIPMVAHDFLIMLSCSIYFPTNFLPEVDNWLVEDVEGNIETGKHHIYWENLWFLVQIVP